MTKQEYREALPRISRYDLQEGWHATKEPEEV